MRRFCMSLAAVAVVALTIVGCGSSGGTAAEETPAAESPAAESPAAESPAGDAWTTVTTLRSDDPQDTEGILISDPFDAGGEVQLVLDMPKGGELDGVLGVIIPADKAGDPSAILDAIPDGASVTLIPSAPTKVVSGLDGTCVFVNSVPTKKAWTLEIQTRQ